MVPDESLLPLVNKLVILYHELAQRDELLRFSFIGFSLVEASGLIGLIMSELI